MSWRHPERTLKDDSAIDAEDTNRAFKPFVDELSGRLNEHNFAANAFQDDDLADDLAIRTGQEGVYVDAREGTGSLAPGPGYWGYDADIMDVPTSAVWAPVDDLVKVIEVPDGGAMMEVTFSCQTMGYSHSDGPHMQLGIEVDGTVVEEIVNGSTDISSEGQGFWLGGAGVLVPMQVTAIVELGEGTHTIQAVVRNFHPEQQGGSSSTGSGAPPLRRFSHMGSRELILMERAR